MGACCFCQCLIVSISIPYGMHGNIFLSFFVVLMIPVAKACLSCDTYLVHAVDGVFMGF